MGRKDRDDRTSGSPDRSRSDADHGQVARAAEFRRLGSTVFESARVRWDGITCPVDAGVRFVETDDGETVPAVTSSPVTLQALVDSLPDPRFDIDAESEVSRGNQ